MNEAERRPLGTSLTNGVGLVTRLVLVAVMSTVTVLVGASAASAHAQLTSSTPENGAVLARSPEVITLEFSEPITARNGQTHLFTGDGQEVSITVVTADRTVTITPESEVPRGTVVLGWAVTSADSHPIQGSVTFAVGAPTPGSSANQVFSEPLTAGVGAAHAIAVVVALLAGVTLVALLLLRRTGRPLDLAWLTALGATVLSVPLGAVQRGGFGWSGMREWEHWIDGWLTWRGLVLAVAIVAAAYAVTAVRRPHRWPAVVVAAVMVMAAPAAFAVPGPLGREAALPGGSPVSTAAAGQGTVRMRLDNVTVGTTGFRLEVLNAAGDPAETYAEPRVRATTEGLDLDVSLTPESNGVWGGTMTLPQPGEWTMEVSVRLSEFENPVVMLPFRIGTRTAPGSGGH